MNVTIPLQYTKWKARPVWPFPGGEFLKYPRIPLPDKIYLPDYSNTWEVSGNDTGWKYRNSMDLYTEVIDTTNDMQVIPARRIVKRG